MAISAPERRELEAGVQARSRPAPSGPTALRVRTPSWRDPRLVVGVLLVLASVVVGARVVTMAGHTDPYYVAARELTPGDRLTAGDLRPAELRLDTAAGSYLSAAQPLADGLVVRRPIGVGEVVPLAAVGDGADVDVRPVMVPIAGTPSDALRKGAVVDVWVSRSNVDTPGMFDPPEQVATAVTVAEVHEAGNGLAGTGGGVEVLVGPAELPVVLDAIANDDVILVVPQPGRG